MWKGSYGEEPFDLRLALLRMAFKFHWIIIATLIGTLLFGGGYYLKNIVFRPEKTYAATSTYKVDYANPDWAMYGTYINEATWNTWVHTKEFLDSVQLHLAQQENIQLTNKELTEMLSAKLASDLRVPSTIVTTRDAGQSIAIATAVEKAMEQEFAGNLAGDISAIRVIDPAVEAKEVQWDVRPVRAFVLSGILSCFFAVVIFLLKELGDDSIYLPATLRRRYGLPSLGTINSPELKANLDYTFRNMSKIAVCSVDDSINTTEVSQKLCKVEGTGNNNKYVPAPAVLLCPENCKFLREAEAVLLVVPSGPKVGKPLEYVLDFLQQQDCEIAGAILWNANERLLKTYYHFPDGGGCNTDIR